MAYSTYNYWSKKTKSESTALPMAPISIRSESRRTVDERGLSGAVVPGVTLAFPNGLRAHFGRESEGVLMDVPDASLLTEIELQKYGYHMPFYRQIKQMAHLGMKGLREATLVGWHKRTMELLRPLYELLAAEVFRSGYVQTDESTVPVINSEKGQADKEYLWMSRAVMEGLVVFFYDEGFRSGYVVKSRTDKYRFRGYMQCDGFGGYTAAYKSSADVRLVRCMVHIRREWERALDENRKAAS